MTKSAGSGRNAEPVRCPNNCSTIRPDHECVVCGAPFPEPEATATENPLDQARSVVRAVQERNRDRRDP